MARQVWWAVLVAVVIGPQLRGQTGSSEPKVEGVFYAVNPATGSLEVTEKQVAKASQSLTHGVAHVSGDRATVRLEANPHLEFRIKLKPRIKPGQYALFRFATENGERVISFKRSFKNVTWLQGEQIQFKFEKDGDAYRILPLVPLGPGEYGFSMSRSDDVYLFGVDAAEPRTPFTSASNGKLSTSSEDVQSRLHTLDELFQKGLITKDEYDRKRSEIAPHTPVSAEERLRKLDDLYKEGLITKEEFDHKRGEILKGL